MLVAERFKEQEIIVELVLGKKIRKKVVSHLDAVFFILSFLALSHLNQKQ